MIEYINDIDESTSWILMVIFIFIIPTLYCYFHKDNKSDDNYFERNILFNMPYRNFVIIGIYSISISLSLCLGVSLLFHFEDSNHTHCEVI